MKKIVILTTDTPHHRFYINYIIDKGFDISAIIFETNHLKPKFKTGPVFEKRELEYEESNFFQGTSKVISLKAQYYYHSVNDESVIDLLKKIKPDFGLIFGTGLVKPKTLKIFAGNIINVHRGIPQSYRGLDSDLWAIYHSDWNNIGCAIHRADTQLDTGDIFLQKILKLKKNMKIHQIRFYTTIMAAELSVNALKDFLSGSLAFHQQEVEGRYYSYMPYDLKVQMEEKFNNFCKKLHE